MPVLQLGVDRTTATVERLAALRAACKGAAGLGMALRRGGCLVALTTCHRLEWYLEGVARREAHALFDGWFDHHPALEPVTCRAGEEAARHLLRVVGGLESAVLGEDQILCQARAAYREACAARRSGRLLHRLFHAAFRAGRRVRSETELGAGTRSLAGAAVAEIHRRLGRLRDRSVLVLGAGEMASLAVRLLASRQVGRLLVANRHPDRAARLAARYGAQPEPWEWRAGLLRAVDAAICATSAGTPVLDAASLRRAALLRSSPLTVVDLGVPPNVEAPDSGAAGAAIDVIDIERLGALLAEAGDRRAMAVGRAEVIVEEELQAWLSRVAAAELPAGTRCPAGARTIEGTCFRSG